MKIMTRLAGTVAAHPRATEGHNAVHAPNPRTHRSPSNHETRQLARPYDSGLHQAVNDRDKDRAARSPDAAGRRSRRKAAVSGGAALPEGARAREVRAMNVYRMTRADRDLLLAGADLEAVLADREKEKLERSERTQARLSEGTVVRLVRQALVRGQERSVETEPDLV